MIKWLRRFLEYNTKGYCSEDLWSFDNWLSRIIAKGLREFKELTHSYPHDIDDWAEWKKILEEMIECFEEQTHSLDNILGTPGSLVNLDGYREAYRKKKEKLHRGLELLERYYYDLWD